MKKALYRLVWLCVGIVGVAAAIGLYEVRAFWWYPVADVTVKRVAPLPALDLPEFHAGVAERDITTPIGIPKMGYSAWARVADGFRNRLKTRAFYLKPAHGEPVAIVQADLPAGSLVLHHRVAELIAAATDVASHNLSIHVTHTHAGPGQYLASDFYNAFGSNKPGFDPAVFEFLARQIADAVIEAFQTRRPAKLAAGSAELYGASKNRSIGAYVANQNVADKATTESAAERAVNPVMTMVRIDALADDGRFLPLGAFSTFAIHGTGIPAFTYPYHGDVWAFFSRDLAWRIAQAYETPWTPVHGPFEANHGDNNPNYAKGLRGELETRRIGLIMAETGWTLFESLGDELTENPAITSAMREINVLDRSQPDVALLCERALAGAALVGAAKGDEVWPISYMAPFKAGWPKQPPQGCHAEKNIMMSFLQEWGLAPDRMPHRVLISSFRVGNLLLMGVPFEVTFESGNRIMRAVKQAVTDEPGIERVVVSSLANGFFGYSTTQEEYSRQWYEGGHTIYGPGTTAFLASATARLAADMLVQPGLADLPDAWHFRLARQQYFPQPEPATGERQTLQQPAFQPTGDTREAYWRFRYRDVNPGVLQLHQPLLSLDYRTVPSAAWQPLVVDGVPVDDQGFDVQLVHRADTAEGMAEYEARWFNPVAMPGEFRFSVAPRAGQQVLHSQAFVMQ